MCGASGECVTGSSLKAEAARKRLKEITPAPAWVGDGIGAVRVDRNDIPARWADYSRACEGETQEPCIWSIETVAGEPGHGEYDNPQCIEAGLWLIHAMRFTECRGSD
jgi:hypothetical protein